MSKSYKEVKEDITEQKSIKKLGSDLEQKIDDLYTTIREKDEKLAEEFLESANVMYLKLEEIEKELE